MAMLEDECKRHQLSPLNVSKDLQSWTGFKWISKNAEEPRAGSIFTWFRFFTRPQRIQKESHNTSQHPVVAPVRKIHKETFLNVNKPRITSSKDNNSRQNALESSKSSKETKRTLKRHKIKSIDEKRLLKTPKESPRINATLTSRKKS